MFRGGSKGHVTPKILENNEIYAKNVFNMRDERKTNFKVLKSTSAYYIDNNINFCFTRYLYFCFNYNFF